MMVSSSFLTIAIIFLIVIDSNALQKEVLSHSRLGGVILRSIKDGESLKGKLIESLRSRSAALSVAGFSENYSKWIVKRYDKEIVHGKSRYILGDIRAGQREGFSSEIMNIFSFHGTTVRYSFVIDDDIYVNVLYVVHRVPVVMHNRLILAICSKHNVYCRQLNAKNMMANKYPFLAQRYYSAKEVPKSFYICHDNVCVKGFMTPGMKPTVNFRFYPLCFYGLASSVQNALVNNGFKVEDYDLFMKKKFKH